MVISAVPANRSSTIDPIEQSRALLSMAVGLGARARRAHRMGQLTDRKAALYVASLARQAARLLDGGTDHDIPCFRSGPSAPGGLIVHYVVRHDRMVGPPAANRFLVVGSDGELRLCVVAESGNGRVWADYDVASAPDDLPLRAVLDSLASLIGVLERAVTQLESIELTRELQLEAEIATAKARIAGFPPERPSLGRRVAASEEPSKPWTRHAPDSRAVRATSDAENADQSGVGASPAVETAVRAAAEPPREPVAHSHPGW